MTTSIAEFQILAAILILIKSTSQTFRLIWRGREKGEVASAVGILPFPRRGANDRLWPNFANRRTEVGGGSVLFADIRGSDADVVSGS